MPWAALLAVQAVAAAPTVRIKDLGRLEGWRDNALVGYGLVTGLAGTGDSPRNRATRQSIANMMSRFDMVAPSADVTSRNVAAVMITASLPAYARPGDRLDVTVTSIGDARSLGGGTLILAPLKAANGRTSALAQGPVFVGGYRSTPTATRRRGTTPPWAWSPAAPWWRWAHRAPTTPSRRAP